MFSIILMGLFIISFILFGLWVLKAFIQISYNVHKNQNNSLYLDMEQHSDLNRFLEEFEKIKSDLLPSTCQDNFKYSLFHNSIESDFGTSMNGLLFRINGVKYVAKNFSDYQKATKVIKEHHDYCVKNNMFSSWAKF